MEISRQWLLQTVAATETRVDWHPLHARLLGAGIYGVHQLIPSTLDSRVDHSTPFIFLYFFGNPS